MTQPVAASGPLPLGRGRAAAWVWRAGWVAAAALPLIFLGIFFAWPVSSLVARGFSSEAGSGLSAVTEVLSAPRTWRIVRDTLTLATLGTLASVLLGLPAAYLLYVVRFPGRGALRAFVTIPFVLPTVVVGVAFVALLGPRGPLAFLGWQESLPAIVAALVFFNFSVVVRTVGGLWGRLDPRAVQAARALGASPARAFRTVTLPALGPAIASAATLVFLFCASAFGIVLVLGGVRWSTIETEIWYQTTQLLDLPAAAALSITQLVIVALALMLTSWTGARQERALRLRGDASGEHAWAWRRDGFASVVTGIVVATLLVLPLATLVVRSLRNRTGWTLEHYRALGTSVGRSLPVPVWVAIRNSLVVALQATVIALVVGVLVSLVVSRRPRDPLARSGLRVLDAVYMLPLGVSAVTVGFGFLITLNRPPLDLRSSMILVPIAQALVALPLVVRSILPVLRAIDPRQREVAATLGAPPWRVLASVDGPFLLRGLGLAAGFAMATSLGEFGATTFLTRLDRPTLPVVIFRLIGRPGEATFGAALAASVVLATLTALVVLLAERLRPAVASDL
ncbi:MAG: iron ABC transporter permease [Nostocoides sp.]|jgi:thiamine transport system permease protein|uniref:ABC transporter permease n=1 Tax=Nostocoides sp. TaxID=1917966 RepID=UPI002BDB87CF|nr:iron ABC transporter permease [Tetrasphaera sp.]